MKITKPFRTADVRVKILTGNYPNTTSEFWSIRCDVQHRIMKTGKYFPWDINKTIKQRESYDKERVEQK